MSALWPARHARPSGGARGSKRGMDFGRVHRDAITRPGAKSPGGISQGDEARAPAT